MKTKVVMFTVLFLAHAALGCRCTEPPPAATRMENSTAVFVGRVTSEEVKGNTRTYRFSLKNALKGDLPTDIQVTTPKDSATCGSSFNKDEEYLIFCRGDMPGGLTTNLCAANREAGSDVGKAEIAELNALKAKEPNSR